MLHIVEKYVDEHLPYYGEKRVHLIAFVCLLEVNAELSVIPVCRDFKYFQVSFMMV